MKQILLSLVLLALTTTGYGQSVSHFAERQYRSLGVYDTWEQSPFRTGRLRGRWAVADNPAPMAQVPAQVLAVQCSRHGSNTFGARIDLNQTFPLTPKPTYIHVSLLKPLSGRVMLVGLGKRQERAGQSPQAEQFWVFSSTPVVPHEWCDAVFEVRGSEGVEIHSLVVVPQCESPHRLEADFAAYIGDIQVGGTAQPRFLPTAQDGTQQGVHQDSHCRVSSNSRNGDILAPDGQPLNRVEAAAQTDFALLARPSRGFRCAGVRITAPSAAIEPLLVLATKEGQTQFVVPAQMMKGEVMLEGLFEEIVSQ